MLDAGISSSWVTGSASASLKTASMQKHHGLIVNFVQRYYSLKFNDPASVTSFLDPSVTLDQVKAVSSTTNPPMYISEVKYGRMVIIAISSDESASSLEAAIRADISFGLSGGSGSLDVKTKQILQNSVIQGLVVGGGTDTGAQLLSSLPGGAIDGLAEFIKDGATYNPNTSPGAPIAYTARYLNGKVADSSFEADFATTGCRDVDIPITSGRISFQVGDDDKDEEMYPFITIARAGTVVADENGLHKWDHAGENGHKWDDHEFHGPFTFAIHDLTLANCQNLQATVGERSTRGSNPGWRTTCKIELLVNGQWFIAKDMDVNHDEFIWGDNHPMQSTINLALP